MSYDNIAKRSVNDLAVFGGAKLFETPFHVGRPNLGDRARLMERLSDTLDRRWLSNAGRYVQEFEKRIAEQSGTKHAVACCNGTVALEIATRALGLQGEVILPSYTFVATAHALQWQGITPVFADIRAADHNLDPAQIERHITPRTSGIMGVHLWGQPCDVEQIEVIARRRKLPVVYDASHAFGCDIGNVPIGGQGQATVFSFHATKFINSLEGGAVVTNDDDLAARMRLMKNFGFRGYDDVGHVGTNGKMNEFSAAMGLTNLEAMDEIVAVNKRNWHLYCNLLADLPGLSILPYRPAGRFNYQYVIAEIAPQCPIPRDALLKVMQAENFLVRRYFWPGCHRMEPYRSLSPNAYLTLPVTEDVAERVLVIPTGQTVEPETISAACELLRFSMSNGSDIDARLKARSK
jgi:dTDP-4-amino-4,6-dideoxygalactose transaminase